MSNIRTTGKKSSNTLVRDLVNVGIFAALYIVLSFLSSSIGYIPALIVFSTGSIALVTSIPLFLFFSKVERSILCGLIFCGFFGTAMFVMGQGILMLAISLLVGLLAGSCIKFIGKSFAGLFSANIVMSFMSSSMMLPLWTSTEEYLEYTRTMCDAGYVAKLAELSQSPWPLVAIYAFGILGAIVGGLVARRVMKKHFERIGLA
ncbi:MptD family putative ECF transporter S component [uncultured Fibrobacter sp.]|jgi:energy-coupling factor transport system substrate-specific component|uniref:MptD family putative ECF transporter S component n=1 Tax=uncultured Fibrobacter sp. TaxID=261512 RepID=UPI0026185FAE|nr:MptD family putative ECF transporter S component [uncultured Fibrobacter sp.]